MLRIYFSALLLYLLLPQHGISAAELAIPEELARELVSEEENPALAVSLMAYLDVDHVRHEHRLRLLTLFFLEKSTENLQKKFTLFVEKEKPSFVERAAFFLLYSIMYLEVLSWGLEYGNPYFHMSDFYQEMICMPFGVKWLFAERGGKCNSLNADIFSSIRVYSAAKRFADKGMGDVPVESGQIGESEHKFVRQFVFRCLMWKWRLHSEAEKIHREIFVEIRDILVSNEVFSLMEAEISLIMKGWFERDMARASRKPILALYLAQAKAVWEFEPVLFPFKFVD